MINFFKPKATYIIEISLITCTLTLLMRLMNLSLKSYIVEYHGDFIQ